MRALIFSAKPVFSMAQKPKAMDTETLEILSAIRQIIADDGWEGDQGAKGVKAAKPAAKKVTSKKTVKKPGTKKLAKKKTHPKRKRPGKKEDILLLTEVASEEEIITKQEPVREKPKVTEETKPAPPSPVEELDLDDALEELVRSMLKEKLQDYLDQHLADIVNKVAAEELAKKRSKD